MGHFQEPHGTKIVQFSPHWTMWLPIPGQMGTILQPAGNHICVGIEVSLGEYKYIIQSQEISYYLFKYFQTRHSSCSSNYTKKQMLFSNLPAFEPYWWSPHLAMACMDHQELAQLCKWIKRWMWIRLHFAQRIQFDSWNTVVVSCDVLDC